jgi:hypothetical protein
MDVWDRVGWRLRCKRPDQVLGSSFGPKLVMMRRLVELELELHRGLSIEM